MFSTVILAAGLGKRMQNPDKPKVLSELNGNPLIDYVLNLAISLNSQKIVLVVGHKREFLISHVQNTFLSGNVSGTDVSNLEMKIPDIRFAVQLEQLGTGHAVQCAASELQDKSTQDDNDQNTQDDNSNVLILAGDTPLLTQKTLETFIKSHNISGADISVLSSTTDNPTGYGRIVRSKENSFTGIVEEKDASEQEKLIKEINSGIYFLSSDILFDMLKSVENNNNQNEYYLTDIISIAKSRNLKVIAENIASFAEIQGINTRKQLLDVEKLLATKNNEQIN